jgi:hypothetical protein
MFDSVAMLDVGSTDGSAVVALDEAPAHWTLHAAPSAFLGKDTSGYAACAEEQAALRPHRAAPEALAAVCASLGWRQGTAPMELEAGDAIVAAEAAAPPGAWRVTLEASEFLVAPSLRTLLGGSTLPGSAASAALGADGNAQAPEATALRLPGFAVHCAGGAAPPLERVTSPLLHCPRVWMAQGGGETGPSRLMQRVASSSSSRGVGEAPGAFVARFSPPQLGNLRSSSSSGSGNSTLLPLVPLDLTAIFPNAPLAQTPAGRSAAAAWRGTFSAETKLDFGGAAEKGV